MKIMMKIECDIQNEAAYWFEEKNVNFYSLEID